MLTSFAPITKNLPLFVSLLAPLVTSTSAPSVQSSSLDVSTGTQEVRCDVHYIPSPSPPSSPKPVVLYIHGGAWVLGGKDLGVIMPLIERCCQDGWAVVSLDYR